MSSTPNYLDKKNQADKIVQRYIAYTAGAGFIPIPLVDTLTIAGMQFVMLKELAELYEVEFKEHRTKSVVGALLGSVGTTASVFKFFPGIGAIVGTVKTSVIGAVYTYALGKVFTLHFDQGGTLLDFDPTTSREFFKQEVQKGKTLIASTKNKSIPFENTPLNSALNQLLTESQQHYADLLKLQTDLNELIAERTERDSKA